MNKNFLNLIPTRYLCPICGRWHDWTGGALSNYDHCYSRMWLKCPNCSFDDTAYYFYIEDGYFEVRISEFCYRIGDLITESINLSNSIKSDEKPIVTFEFNHRTSYYVGEDYIPCGDCRFSSNCNFKKLGDENDNTNLKITVGFEFEEEDYAKLVPSYKPNVLNKRTEELDKREAELEKKEKTLNEREEALKALENKNNKKITQRAQKHEEVNSFMKNNFFNLNAEFGLNTDENISSTLMGIAVRTNGTWRIYDKKENAITDIGDMQLGNLPLFIMPKTKLEIGDLIKSDEGYYYVKKLENGVALTLSASTGELKQVVPVKNLFGFSCYSKVCSLCEELDIGEEMDMETLAIMSTIFGNYGENNGTMNQFLPFMFMKDGFKEGFNLKKLFIISMLTSSQKNQQNPAMQQLLPILILKEKGEDKNGLFKLLALSVMVGGGKSNDPMTQIFMMSALEGEKDIEDLESLMLCSMLSQNTNTKSPEYKYENNEYKDVEYEDDEDEDEECDDLPF